MTFNELQTLETKFQPYLRPGDFTFIGPLNPEMMSDYINKVNLFAPTNFFSTSYKEALLDKPSIAKAVSLLPIGTELRIFIINGEGNKRNIFIHSTIEEYCKKYNIDFK